jgi:hypothetical protein
VRSRRLTTRDILPFYTATDTSSLYIRWWKRKCNYELNHIEISTAIRSVAGKRKNDEPPLPGGQINNLNLNISFSTFNNFQLIDQIKGNSINNCIFLKVVTSVRAVIVITHPRCPNAYVCHGRPNLLLTRLPKRNYIDKPTEQILCNCHSSVVLRQRIKSINLNHSKQNLTMTTLSNEIMNQEKN